ncbi:MAG TPA: helix-turn-helix domain-containing protein [Hydrogenophaga sp.]|uniref:helix-turn-helix transcriptional regulator n=1 Tax=Hydrogenophaga sp. TaxID=1904254 RepID=UPI002C8F22E7|nr:helix-turn-helix domain-containing protein [Hydrogenophaga sp.]HSX95656.1 helix-turn-helix domain-containing protein [Hydrogenophaga sp.]
MTNIADISHTLRARLKRSGMTQEALRQAAGLSRQTAVNVFKGTEDFKLSTLLAVADKLGLELVLLPKAAARGEALGVSEPVVETLVQRALKP